MHDYPEITGYRIFNMDQGRMKNSKGETIAFQYQYKQNNSSQAILLKKCNINSDGSIGSCTFCNVFMSNVTNDTFFGQQLNLLLQATLCHLKNDFIKVTISQVIQS